MIVLYFLLRGMLMAMLIGGVIAFMMLFATLWLIFVIVSGVAKVLVGQEPLIKPMRPEPQAKFSNRR